MVLISNCRMPLPEVVTMVLIIVRAPGASDAGARARGCGVRRDATADRARRCRGRCWWRLPRRSRPSPGNGPQPKMKHGPSTMLSAFASHSVRIASTASPAPRKIALIRKIMNTVTLPPSMMRAKSVPSATISGLAPIEPQDVRRETAEHHAEARGDRHAEHHDLRRRRARHAPDPFRRCGARRSRWPRTRCRWRPRRSGVITDSVSPITATASRPSRDTQKTSTTANSDSITISSTIGTASSRTARLSGSAV